MQFTQQLWQKNSTLFQAIMDLPFIQEMISGQLALDKFQHYIIQDAHYLLNYGKALAVAAAKADAKDAMALFAQSAHDSVIVERSLHENYMQQYRISAQQFEQTPMAPTCAAYSNFLKASCWEFSYPVAIAALLPCFWIYAAVGRAIIKQEIGADNPYLIWINTYADDEFWQTCLKAIAAVDAAAAQASAKELAQMETVFQQSFRFEWMFWQASYQLESWPI